MVVVLVDVLFAELGSAVVEPTFAVLLSAPVAEADTLSTMLNVADAPPARVAIVHVIVPVPPGLGVMQVKLGPVV